MACADISYSCTTEYCKRAWHSAHLPEARTKSAVGWAVSTLGRCLLIRKADKISANAMTTARNTERNDMPLSPREICMRIAGVHLTTPQNRTVETVTGSPPIPHQERPKRR